MTSLQVEQVSGYTALILRPGMTGAFDPNGLRATLQNLAGTLQSMGPVIVDPVKASHDAVRMLVAFLRHMGITAEAGEVPRQFLGQLKFSNGAIIVFPAASRQAANPPNAGLNRVSVTPQIPGRSSQVGPQNVYGLAAQGPRPSQGQRQTHQQGPGTSLFGYGFRS